MRMPTDWAVRDPTRSRTGRLRVTQQLREAVISRYERGETSREVAEGCRVARSTVLRILKDSGVAVPAWGARY